MSAAHRTEDLVAIPLLLQRFSALADTAADIEDYLALITDDARFSYEPVHSIGWPGATYHGREEIRAGVLQRREDGIQGPGTRTLHIVNDITVDFIDDVTARVYATWQYWGVKNDAPACLSIGQYDNVVRRVEGTWRIAERASRLL